VSAKRKETAWQLVDPDVRGRRYRCRVTVINDTSVSRLRWEWDSPKQWKLCEFRSTQPISFRI